MLYDAGTANREAFARTFDVCVIGSGPAGITLARTLAGHGLDVALMEAGGLEYSDESQEFYLGANVGIPSYPPDESRLRFLGGTSGHWEGKCRALDPHDFEARSWVPLSGWPIAKADLDPYQPEAARILDVEQPTELPDIQVKQARSRFHRFRWRWSAPTHFGEKYRDELAASARIALCVRANLTDLRMTDGLDAVTAAVFRSYAAGDPGFTVRARAYALCLGGLENPRALLNCRSQMPGGIGNGHDVVGRYFCDRPTVFTSDMLRVEPQGPESEYYACTRDLMEVEQVTNFAVSVEPRSIKPQGVSGMLAGTAQCLTPDIARLVQRVRGRRIRCYFGGLDEFGVRNDPASNPVSAVGVTIEQVLNPDSRVGLGEEKDAFGLNRIRVDWRLTETDFRTIRTSAIAFGAHVAEQDIGRLKLRNWLLEMPAALPDIGTENGLIAGRQHMCATRMSSDPRTGVVDRDCRVHGVANLYIGGSSVFSTPGYAKPTYTIVQLALRLGEHLGGKLAA